MDRNLLKSKMSLHGYKDVDLASMLKMSKTAVSRRLNGEINFSAPEIAKVKGWLKLTDKEVCLIFLQ